MKVDVYDTINFLKTGFKDYLGARVLLNRNLIYAGSILATNAVEKYLKAVMSISGRIRPVHMDNLEKIKDILYHSNFDIIEKLDIDFLILLGTIYKFRYYDNIKKDVDGFGFAINHFIAELDFSIYRIDKTMVYKENNQSQKTPYQLERDLNNEHLFENNYILKNIDKTKFMENETNMYSLVIRDKREIIDEIWGPIKADYNGKILVLRNFRKDKNNNDSH